MTTTFSTTPLFSKLTATVNADGTATISVASSTVSSERGNYTIAIKSCIALNPSECNEDKVVFKVQLLLPCEITVVAGPSNTDASVDVWGSISVTFNAFTDNDPATVLTNQCSKSYSANFNVGPLPSFITFDSTLRKFTVYSTSMNHIGSYTLTITGTVSAYPTQKATAL